MKKDDASPGLGGGCLGLKEPHRDCAEMQVLHEHTMALLRHNAVLNKAHEAGHGANIHLLEYISLREGESVGGFRGSPFLPTPQTLPMLGLSQLWTGHKVPT